MHVKKPAFSGEFAFVWFSTPGGQRGAYAFQRSGSQWRSVERVLLGYW